MSLTGASCKSAILMITKASSFAFFLSIVSWAPTFTAGLTGGYWVWKRTCHLQSGKSHHWQYGHSYLYHLDKTRNNHEGLEHHTNRSIHKTQGTKNITWNHLHIKKTLTYYVHTCWILGSTCHEKKSMHINMQCKTTH